jgi:lipid-A-disaccharide synthase
MRYYLVAGEASGDLHGSNLIKELKQIDPRSEFRCWGGDLMQAQGATVVKHYRDLAFMGFVEVLMNIRTIFKNLDACKKDILAYKPDVVILIDYPGFNLRIAEFLHQEKIRCFYYISPQVWAWKESRVKKIKSHVDHLFVILPFEKEFFEKHSYKVDFVGHPLLDIISDENIEDIKKDIITLLPGSRKQEISTMLPLMLEASRSFPDYKFVVAGAPSISPSFYEEFTKGFSVSVEHGQTYDLLKRSKAALVTSGTATLETALFGVPEVVCYKGSKISYEIAKRLVKIKYISLVNLILDRPVVTELIQDELNNENIKKELSALLYDPKRREKMMDDFKELRSLLGGKGASKRTAELMYSYLNK